MLFISYVLSIRAVLLGYVPLASQSPYPIKVYFVAKYKSHLTS